MRGALRWPLQCSRQAMDHPRGCGEHSPNGIEVNGTKGSSPRMRGAPVHAIELALSRGIIPADAGSTIVGVVGAFPAEDHPRGCGEHSADGNDSPVQSGSSPRMRGARKHPYFARQIGRIIPADAGSTRQDSGRHRDDWDHPRGCGEHRNIAKHDARLGGSSPRMRGARVQARVQRPGRRIIPADAGSTEWAQTPSTGWKDHPRGCGEHTTSPSADWKLTGSSPRMRGAPALRP